MPRFEFESEACIKCWACQVACQIWHDIPAGSAGFRLVEEHDEGTFPQVKRIITTRILPGCDLCRSNGGAPRCAQVCPTGALRWEETGSHPYDEASASAR